MWVKGQEVRLRMENNSVNSGIGSYTISNTATFVSDSWGKAEGSYGADYNANTTTIQNFTLSNEFTICGWFMYFGGHTLNRCIIGNLSGFPPNGFEIYTANKKLYFYSNGYLTSTVSDVYNQTANGGWTHFAVCVNTTTASCSIYINGNLVNTTGTMSTTFNKTANIKLGLGSVSQQLYGYLDDIQIYNCQLSAAKIGSIIGTLNNSNSRGVATCGSSSSGGSSSSSGGSASAWMSTSYGTSTTGKVLIANNAGVVTPQQSLELGSSDVSQVAIGFFNRNTGTSSIIGIDPLGNNIVWNRENHYITFGTNNTERIRITEGGNVGIGTTNPKNDLQIGGSVASSPGIRLFDSVHSWDINHISSNNRFSLLYDGAEKMTILPTGRIGIRTTDPKNDLQIGGSVASGSIKKIV